MTDPERRLLDERGCTVAAECDVAGTAALFQAAGGARSGKRSRDLERQGLDVDARVQRQALRLSRRVQVVRQSTGEVVAEHKSAQQAARALGIPVGSVWNFKQNQTAKDSLLVHVTRGSAFRGRLLIANPRHRAALRRLVHATHVPCTDDIVSLVHWLQCDDLQGGWMLRPYILLSWVRLHSLLAMRCAASCRWPETCTCRTPPRTRSTEILKCQHCSHLFV